MVACNKDRKLICIYTFIFCVEFGATLEDDLKGDLGGDLFHLAVSLVNAHRDESTRVDESKAREDAARLYEVSEMHIDYGQLIIDYGIIIIDYD